MMENATLIADYAALFEQRMRSLELERADDKSAPESAAGTVSVRSVFAALPGGSSLLTASAARHSGQSIDPQAFIDLAAPIAPLQADPVLLQAEALAALSGRFQPDDLFGPETTEEEKRSVLNHLAPACAIETHGDTLHWLLRKEKRTEVLRRLQQENRLRTALAGSLPHTDTLGIMLRRLLRRGEHLALSRLDQRHLSELSSALEMTDGVNLPRPNPARIRELLCASEPWHCYAGLLRDGFLGRRKELAELRSFVTEGLGTDASWGEWQGLILTGLGGAGKSTLLAQFVRRAVRDHWTTVAILDFDRPGMNPGDSHWLEAELSRQVGRQYPQIADRLRKVRHDLRTHRETVSEQIASHTSENVSDERYLRSLVSELRDALLNVGAGQRSFLLVLDTFEQVTQPGLTGSVLEWLRELSSHLQPISLRVVFSGRLFDATRDQLVQAGAGRSVEVAELQPRLAVRLLEKAGVPRPLAHRLAHSDVLPRRPLELKLLGRMVMHDPETSITELEEELRQGGHAAQELFSGIVYRRVLLRISEETVRKLAYPGLVLRYVTKELIREVLAPEMSEEAAETALKDLASYTWLVTCESDDSVWHRRDLRRSMLQVMIARDPERARRISENAIRYFRRKDSVPEWAEGIYHRLMLMRAAGDGEGLELRDLQQAHPYFSADTDDLPLRARALLALATTGTVPLEEVALLPIEHLADAYQAAGRRLVEAREFSLAYGLFSRRDSFQARDTGPLYDWEIATLFATGNWEPLRWNVRRNSTSSIIHMPPAPGAVFALFAVEPRLGWELDTAEPPLFTEEGAKDPGMERMAATLLLMGQPSLPGIQSTPAWGSASDLLRHRLELISVRDDREPPGITLSPGTLRIDPKWIKGLHREVSEVTGQEPAALANLVASLLTVFGPQSRSGSTVRLLLTAVERTFTSIGPTRSLFLPFNRTDLPREKLLALVRGPDPEFRDPARFALLEAFPGRAGGLRLGELIASLVNLDLGDLQPEAFADALRADPEHVLESYVELVDRTWNLGELLRLARKERPDAPKLAEVLPAWEYWDAVVRAAILKQPHPTTEAG